MVQKFPYYTVATVALVSCYLTVWQAPDGYCQEVGDADISKQIRTYKAALATGSFQIQTQLHLAKAYLQIEAYKEAIEVCQQAITTLDEVRERTNIVNASGMLAEAYYGLGLAYTGLERFEDAMSAYQRSIAYEPDSAYSHAALASVYTNTYRYTEALDVYKTAVKLEPTDEMIQHQLGNVYSKRGDNAAAMHHQKSALAVAPEFADAHYQLGILYAREKRWTEAIASYQTAYSHDATLVEALYNLAQAYFRTGDMVAAREQMALFEKRKAALTPLYQLRGALQRTQNTKNRAQILANIGRLYLKNGLYEKAVWEYEKAVGMDAELAPAYNGLGIAYTMLQRYAKAVAAQQKALKLQPDFVEAHAGIGLVYFMQNKAALALEHYQHAVAMDPEFLEAHLKIGIILLNQKRYAAAADTYKTALVIAPGNAEIYHNLGLCYAQQTKTAKDDTEQLLETPSTMDLTTAALAALEKAVELSLAGTDAPEQADLSSGHPPFLTETYYLIGDIQAKKGDFKAAKAAYLASGLSKAYHALARLSAKRAIATKKNNEQRVTLEAAQHYAHEATRLDPNVASYYNTLALIEFRSGDYLQAEQAIRKALELDPENSNYRQGLKQISSKLGSE